MALNIKNVEVERLAQEVARLTGETKTEAIRLSLLERRQRLTYRFGAVSAVERIGRFLEDEVWPQVPPAELGRQLSSYEEDEILGYGEPGA